LADAHAAELCLSNLNQIATTFTGFQHQHMLIASAPWTTTPDTVIHELFVGEFQIALQAQTYISHSASTAENCKCAAFLHLTQLHPLKY
jgi:hypothetical protein